MYLSAKVGIYELNTLIRQFDVMNDAIMRETILWILDAELKKDKDNVFPQVGSEPRQRIEKIISEHMAENEKVTGKLLTIEKVLVLKSISIFSETDEDVLVEVASIIEEEEVKGGENIFHKGDVGTCMYIIYKGKVRIHDGDHTFVVFNDRDFFGELSLLDPEPRSASVTAIDDTLLLKIDQETFYEIMSDRIEVVRGILKILCRRLRDQNIKISNQNNEIKKLKA